jgi:hypothetical protein
VRVVVRDGRALASSYTALTGNTLMPTLNGIMLSGMALGAVAALVLPTGYTRWTYHWYGAKASGMTACMFIGSILGFVLGKLLGAR